MSPVDFQQQLSELNTVMVGELEDVWKVGQDEDSSTFRQFVSDAYPQVVTPYSGIASDLAADYYGSYAPVGSTYVPVVAPPPPLEKLTVSSSWALSQGSPFSALVGSAQRTLFGSARTTVELNADLDPQGGYARYASANACRFCQMLATRGAVYASEKAATKVSGRGRTDYIRGSQKHGEKFHDWCRCIAVPVRPGRHYEPPPYVEQWSADYEQAAQLAGTKSDLNSLMAAYRQMDKA
ncbi:hypothetical protein ACFU44_00405 [Nocardia rhizosphaerihabitans]|uniref:VG15 protein n=1 Tax=Nocardia rhizosphaerihabitans TaxID=1691570 RepID=UPI003670DC13